MLPDNRTKEEKLADAQKAADLKLQLTLAADRADQKQKTGALKNALNNPLAPGSRMSPDDPTNKKRW